MLIGTTGIAIVSDCQQAAVERKSLLNIIFSLSSSVAFAFMYTLDYSLLPEQYDHGIPFILIM